MTKDIKLKYDKLKSFKEVMEKYGITKVGTNGICVLYGLNSLDVQEWIAMIFLFEDNFECRAIKHVIQDKKENKIKTKNAIPIKDAEELEIYIKMAIDQYKTLVRINKMDRLKNDFS